MKLLIAWLQRAVESIRVWFVSPYRTAIVHDNLPVRLNKRTLYIVQDSDYFEKAALVCPCGCGRVLQMNLLPDARPCWQVTQHADGTATLHPSVWRQKDCKSHFWFRRGRVVWCNDIPPTQPAQR